MKNKYCGPCDTVKSAHSALRSVRSTILYFTIRFGECQIYIVVDYDIILRRDIPVDELRKHYF